MGMASLDEVASRSNYGAEYLASLLSQLKAHQAQAQDKLEAHLQPRARRCKLLGIISSGWIQSVPFRPSFSPTAMNQNRAGLIRSHRQSTEAGASHRTGNQSINQFRSINQSLSHSPLDGLVSAASKTIQRATRFKFYFTLANPA